MAFWALGALDKVKGLTDRLTIKEVGTKLISYVVLPPPPRQSRTNLRTPSPSLPSPSPDPTNRPPLQPTPTSN